MVQKLHNLDYNRLYGLQLDYEPETQQLRVSVSDKNEPWPRLRQALMSIINVANSLGQNITPLESRGNAKELVFADVSREFTLKLGLESIGSYVPDFDGKLTQTYKRPLTVSEVRRIGTFHRAMPYAQNEQLRKKAENAVFTDFHTHSSGQISPEGLLKVARDHDAYYPLEWLREAGIDDDYVRFPKEMRKEVDRVRFIPREIAGVKLSKTVEAVPIRALRDDEVQKLEKLMAMPTDRQSTFSEMENDSYYYRYPLTKNNALTKDIIKQMAREYLVQGVRYAAIDYVGLDKPEQLRALHEAMEEIEADPKLSKVKLRFMVAIPRTLPLPEIEESLEKAKILLDSPYIVGVDVVGCELNKTKHFEKLLNNFCDWANEHKPGCMIRAHAGENDKNLGNVKEMLSIAESHPNLMFGIGHGVYGMDDEAIAIAQRLAADTHLPRLTVEPNPSSVIALNNVDDLKQIPFERMVEHKIPFVVSSDSGGTYHTTARQLGLEAMYGGLDEAGFDQLIAHQHRLMGAQLAFSKSNAEAISHSGSPKSRAEFVDGMLSRLSAVPKPILAEIKKPTFEEARALLANEQVMLIENNDNVPALSSRKPVTIVGASGESWARMTPQAQRESAIAIDMVTHALDPAKAYIENGRTKAQGVGDILRQSIAHANAHPKEPGQVIYNSGFLAEPDFTNPGDYAHYTHVEMLPGKLLDLSSAIVERTFKQQGVLIAVGGASFTRDVITKADQRGMLDDHPTNRKMMLLLQCAQGASAEKATVLSPQYRAIDGRQLVGRMFKHYPELFPANFDAKRVNSLYEEAKTRVDGYLRQEPGNVIDASDAFVGKKAGKTRQP